jgi:hypothetical protein
VFSRGRWGKMAGFGRGRVAGCRASVLILASMFGSTIVPGVAFADSGETLTGVTSVPTASCNSIRLPFAPPLSGPTGGDVFFACYGGDTDDPSCGLFAPEAPSDPEQRNVLVFCQDSFPNGARVTQPPSFPGDPPLKAGITIAATPDGATTGVVETSTETDSNVVCLDFGARRACVKIAREEGGTSPMACPAPSQVLFQVRESDCAAVQSVVNSVAGATSGDVSFALITNIDTLGQARSQGVLVCPGYNASCVTTMEAAFPLPVSVRYQIPMAIVNENPDCYLYRGRRIC